MKIKKLEYYSSSEGGKTWIWERHPNIEDITDKINEIIDKLNERDDAEPKPIFVTGMTTTNTEEKQIEYAPVRHGKWIWVEDVPLEEGQSEYDREAWYQCSECDAYDLRLKDSHADYCWSCGAKMDDDEEDCEEEDNDPKHGHWDIFYNDNIPFAFKCSECGQLTIMATNYCPNCGCRMDLDEVNDD